jgi:hypothetical protein
MADWQNKSDKNIKLQTTKADNRLNVNILNNTDWKYHNNKKQTKKHDLRYSIDSSHMSILYKTIENHSSQIK